MTRFETAKIETRAEMRDATWAVVGRQLETARAWVLADAAGSRAQASRAAFRAVECFVRSLDESGAAFRRTECFVRSVDGSVNESSVADRLRRAVEHANATVYEEELPAPASLVFATSIVAALLSGERLFLAHAGNARCYRFRAGKRDLLTRPHTAVASLDLDEASVFATHNRHLVTRALGIACQVDPELSEHVVQDGDLFVLVNDALRWAVEERQVAELFVHKATAATVALTIARLGDQRGTSGAVKAFEVAETAVDTTEPESHEDDAR